MNKTIGVIFLAISIFTINSCKKENISNGVEYYEGIVHFELSSETSLEQAVKLMQKINQKKFQLNGFKYNTQTSFDSLTYFFDLFDGEAYLPHFDIKYEPSLKTAIFRNMGFENLTSTELIKWKSLINKNNIIENLESQKYGYLYIEDGDETYWINELNTMPEISIADFHWVYVPYCSTASKKFPF